MAFLVPWFLRRFKYTRPILILSRYYLPFEIVFGDLFLYILASPSHNNLCQVWWNLNLWLYKRRQKREKVTDYVQNVIRRTYLIFRVRWTKLYCSPSSKVEDNLNSFVMFLTILSTLLAMYIWVFVTTYKLNKSILPLRQKNCCKCKYVHIKVLSIYILSKTKYVCK